MIETLFLLIDETKNIIRAVDNVFSQSVLFKPSEKLTLFKLQRKLSHHIKKNISTSVFWNIRIVF